MLTNASIRREVLQILSAFCLSQDDEKEDLLLIDYLCISSEPPLGLGRTQGWGFWVDIEE